MPRLLMHVCVPQLPGRAASIGIQYVQAPAQQVYHSAHGCAHGVSLALCARACMNVHGFSIIAGKGVELPVSAHAGSL